MNCPKHPSQKMTLLLMSHVCDLCNPPGGQAPPVLPWWSHAWPAERGVPEVLRPPSGAVIMTTDIMMYAAEVVVGLDLAPAYQGELYLLKSQFHVIECHADWKAIPWDDWKEFLAKSVSYTPRPHQSETMQRVVCLRRPR